MHTSLWIRLVEVTVWFWFVRLKFEGLPAGVTCETEENLACRSMRGLMVTAEERVVRCRPKGKAKWTPSPKLLKAGVGVKKGNREANDSESGGIAIVAQLDATL